MFSQYLQSIDFVTIYPMIGLFFFMPVFIGIVIWAFRADDEYIRKMENLPLDAATDR